MCGGGTGEEEVNGFGLRIAMNKIHLNLDSSAEKKGSLIKLHVVIFQRETLGFEEDFRGKDRV